MPLLVVEMVVVVILFISRLVIIVIVVYVAAVGRQLRRLTVSQVSNHFWFFHFDLHLLLKFPQKKKTVLLRKQNEKR